MRGKGPGRWVRAAVTIVSVLALEGGLLQGTSLASPLAPSSHRPTHFTPARLGHRMATPHAFPPRLPLSARRAMVPRLPSTAPPNRPLPSLARIEAEIRRMQRTSLLAEARGARPWSAFRPHRRVGATHAHASDSTGGGPPPPTPDPALDSATVSVYTLGGYDPIAQVTTEPQNYQDAQGNWAPIDAYLQPVSGGWQNTAGPEQVLFPSALSATTPLTFTTPSGSLTSVPDGLASSVPGQESSDLTSVTYPAVAPSVDVQYQTTTTGYDESLVLQADPQSPTFAWDLTASGLTLSEDSSGLISLESGGSVVGNILPPVVTDAAGAVDSTTPDAGGFSWALVDNGNGTYVLTLTYDQAWLTDPSRVYPVTVDPNVTYETAHLNANHNTDINANSAGTNYCGTSTILAGGSQDGFDDNFYGLVNFPVSALLNSDLIVYGGQQGAELIMYPVSGYSTGGTANIRRVTNSWDCSNNGGVTWNNASGVGSTIVGDAGYSQGWETWYLGGIYQNILDETYTNHGLRVGAADSSYYYGWDTRSEANPPQMYIYYFILPPAATPKSPLGTTDAPAVVSNPSPTLEVSSIPTDQSGNPSRLNFEVTNLDPAQNPNAWDTSNLVAESGFIDAAQWQVTGGTLEDGKQYWWRAQSGEWCVYQGGSKGLCSNVDPNGNTHDWNTSSVQSIRLIQQHYGSDTRYAMWKDALGNDMSLQVNEANGNAYLDVPLASFKTPLGPLDLGISYNSEGSLGLGLGAGAGWSVDAGPGTDRALVPTRLQNDGGQDDGVAIYFGDGSVSYFSNSGGDLYQGSGSEGGTVLKNSSSSDTDKAWTYITANGSRFVFDQNGDLSSATPNSSGGWQNPGFSYVYDTTTYSSPVLSSVSYPVGGGKTHTISFAYTVITPPHMPSQTALTQISTNWNVVNGQPLSWTLGYTASTAQLDSITTEETTAPGTGTPPGPGTPTQQVLSFSYDPTLDPGTVSDPGLSNDPTPHLTGIQDGAEYWANPGDAEHQTTIAYEGAASSPDRVAKVWAPGIQDQSSGANAFGISGASFSKAVHTVEPTTFTYSGSLGGDLANTTYVTDPRGSESGSPTATMDGQQVSAYETRVEVSYAGLPVQILGPAEWDGRMPETLQVWNGHGQLKCARTPAANAFYDPSTTQTLPAGESPNACYLGNPGYASGSTVADPLNTDYTYQSKPPYKMLKEQQPVPDASNLTAARPTTTWVYDTGTSNAFSGLVQEQMANSNLAGEPTFEQVNQGVNEDWGTGGCPSGLQSGGTCPNAWSLRYTGQLTVATSGTYAFKLTADDGVTLVIGSKVMTSCTGQSSPQTNCGDNGGAAVTKDLTANQPVAFTLEYRQFNDQNYSKLQLQWDQGNGNWQSVPSSIISPNTDDLTQVTDPNGTVTSYGFASDAAEILGQASSVSVGSRQTSYAYDAYGNMTSKTVSCCTTGGNQSPLVTTYSYTWDDGTSVDQPCQDKVTDPVANANANDPAGAIVTNTCDGAGDVTKTETALAATGGSLAQQPAENRIVESGYNEQGLLLWQSAPYDDPSGSGDGTSFSTETYDLAGRLVSKTVPITPSVSATTAYAYDQQGNLIEQDLPAPGPNGPSESQPVRLSSYDEAGNRTSTTYTTMGQSGPNQSTNVWCTAYDAANRPVGVAKPPAGCTQAGSANTPGSFTTWTAYSFADRTVATATQGGPSAAGGSTGITITDVATSDQLGRTVSEVQGGLPATTYAYDLNGNLVSKTASDGVTTDTTYDPYDEPTSVTCETCGPGGTPATSYDAYDTAGRLVSVTDANNTTGAGDPNHTRTYTYDADGRMLTASLPAPLLGTGVNSGVTSATYDAAGEMVTITDGAGRERDVTTDYTTSGEKTTLTDANNHTTSTQYDLAGEKTSVTLPASMGTLSFTYDDLGNMVEEDSTVAGGGSQYLVYDDRANLLSASSSLLGVPKVEATYDDANRPATVTEQDSSGTTLASSTYTYLGTELQQVQDPAGTTTYGYAGGTGAIGSLGNPLDAGTLSYGYDGYGRLQTLAVPDGLTTTYGYDPGGRPSSESIAPTGGGAAVASFALSFDGVGNVVSDAQSVSGYASSLEGTWSYGYDQANRLTSASLVPSGGGSASESYSYSYDGAGNMTSTTANAVTTSFPYDAAGQLTSSGSGASFATNAAGQLTAASGVPGLPNAAYSYSPFGNLAQAVVTSGSLPGTYGYAFDALGRLYTETRSGSQPSTYFDQGLSFSPSTITAQGVTSRFVSDPTGVIAKVHGTGTPSYVVANLHGDVVGFAASGAITGNTSAFDPFGNLIGSSSTGSALGYQGEVTDPATGLVNMQARLYAPGLGRFSTQDSVFGSMSDPTSLDQFVYGGDNPVTMTDPTGHMAMVAPSGGPCNRKCQEWENSYHPSQVCGGESCYNVAPGGTLTFIPPPPPPPVPMLHCSRFGCTRTTAPSWMRWAVVGFVVAVAAVAVTACVVATDGACLGLAAAGGTVGSGATELVAKVESAGGGGGSGGPDDELLSQARAARDALAEELGSRAATVTGGYNVQTGEVSAGCSGPVCAEDSVVEKLGGNASDIQFTEAIRPRTGLEVPVCEFCQARYGSWQFPPEVQYKPGFSWDLGDGEKP